MITSFFKPKSQPAGKRSRDGDRDVPSGNEAVVGTRVNMKQLVSATTTAAAATTIVGNSAPQTSTASHQHTTTATNSKPLSKEAATLLSFLHTDHDGDTDVDHDAMIAVKVTWRKALIHYFATTNFTTLAKFVANERASKTVYPPPQLVFSAMNLTPLHTVKVVIVGQDPYHQPNQGHGLSFSVPHGIMIPPSLRNIYKELHNDADVHTFTSIPTHGNLERWAKQGVLLLNNVLTVRRGEAASHAKKGWEQFTDTVIGAVIERDGEGNGVAVDGEDDDESDDRGTGVVFLLWGKPASLKAQTVLSKYSNNKRAKHAVIMCSHPSPLGATKTDSPFMGSKCFSKANEELVKRGWREIDWRVDGPL